MTGWRKGKRLAAGIVASLIVFLEANPPATAAGPMPLGPSGLPLPRFVSLKADKINVHLGPGKNYDVRWVYTRAGLPVEITAEFENWRRIRDSEGSEGWVYHSLLSGRRTGLVTVKDKTELVPTRDAPSADGKITARLQPGVIAIVKECNGSWCRVSGDQFDGWIEQDRLWGVYPNEKLD
ncbi:MAG TPA: SH3 domain-containing protein [Xanthobacteraceae bacterium]|nr:SH3 domain-containing protein [Xanthobacteraceae bacterium]